MARADVSRVALSADVQTNWMPRTLGAMSLRPGMEYLGSALGDGAYLPFASTISDTAIVELANGKMRVWVGGADLLTRVAVSTAVTNGGFDTDLTGWTDADEAGASSYWEDGKLKLSGTGYFSAKRRQQVTVSLADQDKVHALRIDIPRGPLLLRIGSTAGDDDIFRQAVLRSGQHSIAFTPGGNFWIEFSSSLTYLVHVGSVEVEAAGIVELPTPWPDAATAKLVRAAKVGDILFCACEGYQQRRIERRDNGSWSIVLYEANDGPFLPENTDFISLTPSGTKGGITLSASKGVFDPEHVGAIFRMSSQGQFISESLGADPLFTDAIRVVGVGATRAFTYQISGTWTGTITLQRSIDEEGSWSDVVSRTSNISTTYDDKLDNVIAYYRLGFKSGAYGSGTADLDLTYTSGSITGEVRIVEVASSTSASANVLRRLGGTAATEVWAEGEWSHFRGWPSAVAMWEGRLWWAGNGKVYGSVSDALTLFDPDIEGDSGPINRRVGDGAASDDVNWLMPLQRLIAGTTEAEYSIRSNSFDEPVTPSNYNAKAPSTKGTTAVAPAISDGRGYFVDRTRRKVFEMQYDAQRYEFAAMDVSLLVPEIGDETFVKMALQQSPDMRLHCVRGDGTAAILIRDAAEDVLCWVDIETDGFIEDAVVLPGEMADRVFYRVRRTIEGVEHHFHERWALDDDCRGGTVNMQADCFVTGTGAVDGLGHLEGETVVVWGDGADLGSAVVSGGAVPFEADEWCAGLPYEARYRSAKLAGQTALGLSLTQRSRIDHVGLILADAHYQGLRYGPSFDVLDDLPMVEDGAVVDDGTIWESYDRDMVEFPGEWSPDNRICLVAAAPRPCTVLAAVLSIDRQDKA